MYRDFARLQSIAESMMLLCSPCYSVPNISSRLQASPIDDGAVLVRDGRIVEVGGAQRMKAHYPQEEVRDFGRSAIMPGFVDCHTHLEYTALRGIVHDVPYARLVTEHAKADMMSLRRSLRFRGYRRHGDDRRRRNHGCRLHEHGRVV